MTTREAIRILKEQQAEFNDKNIDYAGVNEAYNLAIKALEEKPEGKQILDSNSTPNKEPTTSWWQKRSPGYSCDNCGYFDFGTDRVCEQCGCKMLGFYYKGPIYDVRTGTTKGDEYYPFDEGDGK